MLLRGPESDNQSRVDIDEEIQFITDLYRGLSLTGDTNKPAEQEAPPVSPETASEPVLEAEQQQTSEAVESEPVEATHLGNRDIDLEGEPERADKAGEAISPVTTRDDAIAIVSERDSDGISWFHLAVKVPGHDSWNLQSIYPQHSDRQSRSFEPNRKGYGWQDESWVRSHLVANDDLGELLEYLTTSERGRLIPDQRSPEPQSGVQADSGELQAEASELELPQQSAQDEPAREEPKPAGQSGHAVNRGQLGLFDELPSPETTRSEHILEPIPSSALQMGLFDDTSTAADGEQTIVARAFREAALEVRATDERGAGNMEERERRLASDGAHTGTREERSSDLAPLRRAAIRRLSSSNNDEDWTPEDEALFDAEMEARDQNQPDPGEIDRWRQSLTGGEERDMQDMLENCAYAGAPEPTERAVLGKFTQMVGSKPKLAEIIHDAIEHYEPYGSMVARIERETGRVSSIQDRGARSLYNATLAQQSGWEAER